MVCRRTGGFQWGGLGCSWRQQPGFVVFVCYMTCHIFRNRSHSPAQLYFILGNSGQHRQARHSVPDCELAQYLHKIEVLWPGAPCLHLHNIFRRTVFFSRVKLYSRSLPHPSHHHKNVKCSNVGCWIWHIRCKYGTEILSLTKFYRLDQHCAATYGFICFL